MKPYWLLLLLGMLACGPRTPSGLPAESIRENNHGVGLMGQFRYEDARVVFEQLQQRHPEEAAIAVNLAIATLNRQESGDEATALGILSDVLTTHPKHAAANYCSGLLLVYQGKEAEATTHFQAVLETKPDEPWSLYQRAQIHLNAGDAAAAVPLFEKVIGHDPYFRSAYYGAFRAMRQSGDEGARAMMETFQQLKNNPRAHVFEFKYTRMGALANAATLPAEQGPLPQRPDGPLFDPTPVALKLNGEHRWEPPGGVATSICDIDGDGILDIFAAGAINTGSGTRNGVFLADGAGDYRLDIDHPLAKIIAVRGALWGDYDNDGLTDVYLLRGGPNQLWQRQPDHGWRDVTAATQTALGANHSLDGAFLDADHDGDLDILVIQGDGANALLNNNRDGSFRDIAADQGLAGNGNGRALLSGDLDGDRDLDLVILNQAPPHQVLLNDRLWAWSPGNGFEDFLNRPLLAGVAADIDADGRTELVTLEPGKISIWRAGSVGAWSATDLALEEESLSVYSQVGVLDLDGDGAGEIVYSHDRGWSVLNATGETLFKHDYHDDRLVDLQPLMATPGQGPAMIERRIAGGLFIHRPGSGRFPFMALTLSGKEDTGASMRSNASGIGTQVAARAGDRWSMSATPLAFSGAGQSQQPLALGLAGADRADFVALLWSDGVFQSELDLAVGQVHQLVETQRQLASCPVLFAWDGEKYAFVSDILGVGGIGFALGPDSYSTPRPYESFMMPPGSLVPRNDRLEIKIGEPMEEVCYLDAANLASYDLPQGWQMVIDERMAAGGREPSGQPIYYREERLPLKAIGGDGADHTETLTTADRRAAPVGALDTRFLGLLGQDQVVTLQFEKPLTEGPGEPVLMIDGWVEYPYSQTMFAASQAKVSYNAPVLEVRAGDGPWIPLTVLGYPAGMPRRMAAPLLSLPHGATALRITTNLQVYWDRFAVVYEEPDPGVVRHLTAPVEAHLQRVGFPRRSTGPQMLPHYDYNQRVPFWDTRYMDGAYTAFGRVDALLREADDAVAIFGPGEEVSLAYPLPPQLAAGSQRVYVLEAHGWCKDMDLYTRTGETVGPLPDSGKPAGPRDQLHARFNTRYRSGL